MTLSLATRRFLVVFVMFGVCVVSLSYTVTKAHASLAGDINCHIGDILGNLPGPSGCDDNDTPPGPTDVCPNDAGVQTTTPCASDDVCPNDSGIQTTLPCASENTGSGDNGGGNQGGDNTTPPTEGGTSGGTNASGQTEPNGGGIAPGSTGGGSGGIGGGGIVLGTTTVATSTVATSTPEIIPTANICDGHAPYLKTYLRMGKNNDAEEVKKLQTFLNLHLDLAMPVTGFFGPLTFAAVNSFQVKHSQDVLFPWVAYGLIDAQTPTGYVYKTTQRMINQLACEMELPMPQLP